MDHILRPEAHQAPEKSEGLTDEELIEQVNEQMKNKSTDDLLSLAMKNPYWDKIVRAAATASKHTFLGSLLDYRWEFHEKSVVCRVPITSLLFNGLGIVHGGIMAMLADTAMGICAAKVSGRKTVTLSLTVNYLQPGIGNELIAYADIVHMGGRIITTRCEVKNDRGDIVIQGTGTFYALKDGRVGSRTGEQPDARDRNVERG